MSREDWRRSWRPWLRGTAIGFPLGVLPVGGSVIPTFLSYSVEKRLSARPEEFGHGAIEGVAGPEAANNAAAAGVLVPLLTLGLPSSATAAVLLAAFQQYGLQPGPLLFSSRPDLVWTLIASLYIGNVMLLVLNLPLVGVWARVMLVPRPLLFGGILVLASLGTYSLNASMLDLVLLYAVGGRRLRDARATTCRSCRPCSGWCSARSRSCSSGARSPSAKAIRPVFVTRPLCAALLAAGGALALVAPPLVKRCVPRARPPGHDAGARVRRRRARRRQRGAVRGAHRARGGPPRGRRRARAAPLSRRQQPSHAQPALRARRADRRAHRRVRGGRVPGRPASRQRRRDGRGLVAPAHPAVERVRRVDGRGTACASSRRCAARCTCRAPTRSSSAAARR